MARILYAEDDESVAALVDFRLSAEGHEVTLARDGATARTELAEGDHDVVLLDVMMPGVDGFTLVSEAARLEPRPRIIVITAREPREAAAVADRAGADSFLSKPFDPEELVRLVEGRDGTPG